MLYDKIGIGYRVHRRPDPQIAKRIKAALGPAESVLNIGAGAGSYEPSGILLVAVEPASTMISQRPAGSAPCVQAVAESLPFRDASFDAVMGVLTLHHWLRLREGLRELRRIAKHRIVLLTWDPECDEQFWLTRDYLPEILAFDRRRFPRLATLEEHLGPLQVERMPIPADCSDGFRSAYWKRPALYLNPEIQKSISSFAQSDPEVVQRAISELTRDLESGEWDRRNRELEPCEALDTGYRIVTSSW